MPDLYRPSNGSEGDWFESQFCERCEKDRAFWQDGNCDPDKVCMIHNLSYVRQVPQWIYVDGEPVCTEFEEAKS